MQSLVLLCLFFLYMNRTSVIELTNCTQTYQLNKRNVDFFLPWGTSFPRDLDIAIDFSLMSGLSGLVVFGGESAFKSDQIEALDANWELLLLLLLLLLLFIIIIIIIVIIIIIISSSNSLIIYTFITVITFLLFLPM